MDTAAPTFAPGTTFAGYRIESVAGRGGMGIVYRATQLALGRPVALKLLATQYAADEDFRERFKREWETAAAIDHPNVIPLYEAGEAQDHLFLAMRYVDGVDLANLIARDLSLDAARGVRILAQIASALDAAHARGLVHRDVKPANVLMGAEDHVYLTDFGLSRLTAQSRLTRTGLFVGSTDYAAPEQIRGEDTDARTDVYALGCVLYQLLTRRVPFDRASDMATMYAHITEPAPLVSAVWPEAGAFDPIVERALAKEPGERYQSAGELARAAAAVMGMPVPSRPEPLTAADGAQPRLGHRPGRARLGQAFGGPARRHGAWLGGHAGRRRNLRRNGGAGGHHARRRRHAQRDGRAGSGRRAHGHADRRADRQVRARRARPARARRPRAGLAALAGPAPAPPALAGPAPAPPALAGPAPAPSALAGPAPASPANTPAPFPSSVAPAPAPFPASSAPAAAALAGTTTEAEPAKESPWPHRRRVALGFSVPVVLVGGLAAAVFAALGGDDRARAAGPGQADGHRRRDRDRHRHRHERARRREGDRDDQRRQGPRRHRRRRGPRVRRQPAREHTVRRRLADQQATGRAAERRCPS